MPKTFAQEKPKIAIIVFMWKNHYLTNYQQRLVFHLFLSLSLFCANHIYLLLLSYNSFFKINDNFGDFLFSCSCSDSSILLTHFWLAFQECLILIIFHISREFQSHLFLPLYSFPLLRSLHRSSVSTHIPLPSECCQESPPRLTPYGSAQPKNLNNIVCTLTGEIT